MASYDTVRARLKKAQPSALAPTVAHSSSSSMPSSASNVIDLTQSPPPTFKQVNSAPSHPISYPGSRPSKRPAPDNGLGQPFKFRKLTELLHECHLRPQLGPSDANDKPARDGKTTNRSSKAKSQRAAPAAGKKQDTFPAGPAARPGRATNDSISAELERVRELSRLRQSVESVDGQRRKPLSKAASQKQRTKPVVEAEKKKPIAKIEKKKPIARERKSVSKGETKKPVTNAEKKKPVAKQEKKKPVAKAARVTVTLKEEQVTNLLPENPQPAPNHTRPFLRIPLEIRDQIYRLVLAAGEPIRVMMGWTRVYARWKTGIDIGILLVCRQTAREGIRALYSANTFQYLLRDNVIPDFDVDAIAMAITGSNATDNTRTTRARPRRGAALDISRPRQIFTAKYAHLFRHLALVTERNRPEAAYRDRVARALEMLNGLANPGVGIAATSTPAAGGGLALDTFSLTIYPEAVWHSYAMRDGSTQVLRSFTFLDYFHRGGAVLKAIERLPVNAVTVVVHTPRGRTLRTTVDMRLARAAATSGKDNLALAMTQGSGEVGTSLAAGGQAGYRDVWAGDVLAQEGRERKAREARDKLGRLRDRIFCLCAGTSGYVDRLVEKGVWTEVVERTNTPDEAPAKVAAKTKAKAEARPSTVVKFTMVGGGWTAVRV